MTTPEPGIRQRLPLVDASDDAAARELFGKLAAGGRLLNLHRMMAHAPALMKASGELAQALRRETKLARPLAELVILRIAQVTDCEYIHARHLPLARDCGVTEPQIEQLADWPHGVVFTPAQKAALRFAESAALLRPVEDAAFAQLRREFSPQEIVEIAMLAGNYVSTAIFIKALAVPAEQA